MNISNATILKAAQAAGLDIQDVKPANGVGPTLLLITLSTGAVRQFFPRDNDTDNAMIRRGAEIDVAWRRQAVQASAYDKSQNAQASFWVTIEIKDNDKAQAEREAVILCAAAKFDAGLRP